MVHFVDRLQTKFQVDVFVVLGGEGGDKALDLLREQCDFELVLCDFGGGEVDGLSAFSFKGEFVVFDFAFEFADLVVGESYLFLSCPELIEESVFLSGDSA
jgi:hypothetical protein